MFAEERRKGILDYLNQHERASVPFLSNLFGVTKETIRADLRLLSSQGGLKRCHGAVNHCWRKAAISVRGESAPTRPRPSAGGQPFGPEIIRLPG